MSFTPEHYSQARKEHAFLCRCEGETLERIGERLGHSKERAARLVWDFGARLAKAMRRTKFTIVQDG